MYDHIRDTYFPQITQTHKELENNFNFDELPYLLGEIPKGNQWRTNTIVNTTHIYVYLFSIMFFNYLHIVTPLYIAIIWYLKCLYSFGTLWV